MELGELGVLGNTRYLTWAGTWLSVILGLEAGQDIFECQAEEFGFCTFSVLSINLLTPLHLIVWLWYNYFICRG